MNKKVIIFFFLLKKRKMQKIFYKILYINYIYFARRSETLRRARASGRYAERRSRVVASLRSNPEKFLSVCV